MLISKKIACNLNLKDHAMYYMWKIKQLGHLGLIAAVIKKLNIIEKIDLKLPVSKEHGSIVTVGQRVAAMILNGLVFLNDRLYMHLNMQKTKGLI